ncbi:MAG: hypothetical protein A2X67_05575 [Ignavibacteria bacterium GWA2_55_11]|nr:MAG: hypothetical protein A2X67_05575 [Ignavibacteria bacterium GWA2_55_11]OGU46909.1 MAG: hypothetical protein A2X68_02505 [Ignavibacteria bacterium GWC2_56_12]OGU63700.1 MAG: hypothetical protein A3C56_04585 [Ignavibacteria bacterium RIFCSPHIGHO2_02_FULL_56_12]OGU72971.1 MAG: hypothetical protein A3G43_01465 [Ignavibacteria bacterium RIFCSPLOWO2_12_FULL_56_21]OGU73723.1 MAG: hypothetical protein A3H45_03535 [Ignavibacteria bacterium RIFCSPLOWO2_02_FULL_55_14]HAV23745.1 hypothetical protei
MTDRPQFDRSESEGPGPSVAEGPSYLERRNIPPLLFAIISIIAVFFLYQVGGGLLTYTALGGLEVTPMNVQGARLVTMIAQLLFILTPALILARFVRNDWRAVFPLRLPSIAETIAGFLGLLAVQRVLESLVFFQKQIPLPEIVRAILGPIKEIIQAMMKTLVSADSTAEFMFVVVVVSVVPAVVEESYFRGLLQYVFAKAWNPLGGALVTGAIFGLYHLNPFDALGLVGLGMFLGYLRYRSASLVLPVALHFANNLFAVIAIRMGMAYDETLPESIGQTPTAGIMLLQLVLFGAALALILRFYHQATRSVVGESM